MAHHQPFQVIGFHSCEKKVGLDILNGKYDLNPSKNSWDWLGEGIYFWEHNPQKAMQYALDCAKGSQKFSGKIKTPFVIGAIIELGNCLNLVEPQSLKIVKAAHIGLEKVIKESDLSMPKNKGANRALDCSVIQYVHEINKRDNLPQYDTIRSPFHEGNPIYPDSNFTEGLHIEICVCNSSCIKGYFLPRPLDDYNPYLRKKFKV